MTQSTSTLAETVRELRTEKGLSQQGLASLVGITNGAVSNWEQGTRANIRGNGLFKLAATLGVGPEEFLGAPSGGESFPIAELQVLAAFRQLTKERQQLAIPPIKALKGAP